MNTFGQLFRITTFGESHGPAIGVVIDGCPAGLPIDNDFIQYELSRRRPGQSKLTTQRKEDDTFTILSGVFEGKSTGAPIALVIENKDARSKDYDHLKTRFARRTLIILMKRNMVFATTAGADAARHVKQPHGWPLVPLQNFYCVTMVLMCRPTLLR